MNIFNFFNASARHGSLTSLVYLGWLVQRCCSWYVIFSGLLLLIAFPAFASYVPITGVSQLWKGGGGPSFHSCVLTNSGGVRCWGNNDYAQLGDNSTTGSLIPVDVSGLTGGATTVAIGFEHTCALVSGGAAQCWGANGLGELGDSTTAPRLTPVAVSGLSSGVTAVATGWGHTCASVKGGAQCWGFNNSGQLGNNSTLKSSIPVAVSGLTSGVTTITTGYGHSCALVSGGAKCWGLNDNGQLGNSSTLKSLIPVTVSGLDSGVTAIATSYEHTCALVNGGVQCWGYNSSGQLGNGSTADSSIPVAVKGLTSGVTAITTGDAHTCALTSSGGVQCWGYNNSGELGDNSTTKSLTPVTVSGLSSGVTAIASGKSHTCALVSSGIKCWGLNDSGQLGDNSTTNRLTPVDVLVFNTPPTATSVSINLNSSGTPIWNVGEILKGSYTYDDVESDAQKGTTFQWYQATDGNCRTGKTAISGATTQTYTATSADIGKYLCFGITPKNVNDTGTEVSVTRSLSNQWKYHY